MSLTTSFDLSKIMKDAGEIEKPKYAKPPTEQKMPRRKQSTPPNPQT